ncbi:NUDIX hydrolase [Candidatus Kaiserbacteria bacterium]|nr:NUDIX hydrolase [Candidatus Kaiserbacteria bacterium]
MVETSKHFEGGSVVVVAVVGQTEILLIRETTKPLPIYWKLVSETVEPGESLLNAVIGGIREEAGFKDIAVEYGPDGKVKKVIDPRIKRVVEFGGREWIKSRYPHWRHFFGILTTDEVIKGLSGKYHKIDESEEINTQVFSLNSLHTLPDLLRQHAELIRSIPRCSMTEV